MSNEPVVTKEDLESEDRWRRMVWTAGDVTVKKPKEKQKKSKKGQGK